MNSPSKKALSVRMYALLAEKAGVSVRVLPGSKYNIKITDREDVLMAEAVLSSGLFTL